VEYATHLCRAAANGAEIADESRLQLLKDFCRRCPDAAGNSPRASRFPARISVGVENGAHGAVIEAEVSSNRPDCLGHYGIAREVAANYKRL